MIEDIKKPFKKPDAEQFSGEGVFNFQRPAPRERPAVILRRKLLGAYHQSLKIRGDQQSIELPNGLKPKDAIISRISISLDWWDWFRLLFGCKLQVDVITYTQNVIGCTDGPEVNVYPTA